MIRTLTVRSCPTCTNSWATVPTVKPFATNRTSQTPDTCHLRFQARQKPCTDVQDLTENTCEVTSLPTAITYDLPIQIEFMVYQYAKLKMLMFYCDFLTKYIDRCDFQLCEMDTDSLYFALSSTNLDDIVIPEKKKVYYSERHLWLPSESCDDPHHRNQFV